MRKIHIKRPIRFLSVLMATLITISFYPAAFGQTVKIEDGVTVVRNPKVPEKKPGVPVEAGLVEELSIGPDSGQEESIFSGVNLITAGDDGAIYVADYKEAEVKVFDEKGKYLRTIGRKGQGPGEFQLLSGLDARSDGTLVIWDGGNRKFSFFSKAGELLKEIPTSSFPLDPMAMDSEGRILGSIYNEDDKGSTSTIARFDSMTKKRILYGKSFSQRMDMLKEYEVVKGLILIAGLPNGRFAWMISDKYEIFIVDYDGKIEKKIIKEYEKIPISESVKKEFTDYIHKSYGERFKKTKVIFPRDFHPVSSMRADEKGRLFVSVGGVAETDVFDTEGCLIARIKGVVTAVHKDKVYSIDQDKRDGYPIVKRYRIEWK